MPAAVGTVVMGIGLAVLLIVHMRQPKPVVIEKPPVIIEKPPVIIEKPVTKTVEKVVRVEVPPPPVSGTNKTEERTLTTVPKEKSEWKGIWRRKETPLPMFKVGQDGQEGTCAANWGTIVGWKAASVAADALEFVVDEDIIRAMPLRMTMTGKGKAKVEQWVTDDDWMTSLQRANRGAKTPQQRQAIKMTLLMNARRYRKPVVIGIFIRQAD